MLLYIGVVLFICGNFLGLELEVKQELKFITSLLLLLSVLCLYLIKKKLFINIFICCIFAVLGILNGSRDSTSAETILSPHIGETVVIQGRVDGSSIKEYDNGYSVLLQCEQFVVGSSSIDYKHKVRVFLDKKQFAEKRKLIAASKNEKNIFSFFSINKVPQLPIGKVAVKGKLEGVSSFRNPGSFDSRSWNRVHGVGGRIKNASLLKFESNLTVLDKATLINISLREYLHSELSTASSPLLCGMLLGGGSDIDEETRELFVQNGIAHLLSVSGAHLVLLISILSLLLRPVTEPWRKSILLLFLLSYCTLCGFKPPILRALVMSTVILYGGKGVARGLLLGFTAVGLLLCEPIWLLDLGFQLSFTAVAGIIWLQPKCQQILEKFLPEFISELGAVTMAAQLAVLPLEVGYFHQFSIVSFLSNLCLVPVLETALFLTLGGMVLSFTPMSDYLFLGASFLTEQIIVQAECLAGLPFSTLLVGMLPLWCGVVYYTLVVVWADVPVAMYLSNIQRIYIIIFCSIILCIVLYISNYGSRSMQVFFLDVGQGDCAVIVTPSSWMERSKVIVFDTGGLKNYSTGSKILAPFLRTLGTNAIDLLVLSHYDFDHVGGAADLSRVCKAKQVILPKELLTKDSEKLVLTLSDNWKNSSFSVSEAGQQYKFNDVMVKIVDVPKSMTAGNEASTLVAISYKNYKLLFTGDLGEERESMLNIQEQYDVLKAAHHGSRYSSSGEFLKQIRPKFTIISCGTGNRYGHPHQETLERFSFYGSKILRTDKDGCIKLVFYSEGIQAFNYDIGEWRKI